MDKERKKGVRGYLICGFTGDILYIPYLSLSAGDFIFFTEIVWIYIYPSLLPRLDGIIEATDHLGGGSLEE